jgi:hypothetical protein
VDAMSKIHSRQSNKSRSRKKQQIFDPNALKKDGSGSLILIWVLANFDL